MLHHSFIRFHHLSVCFGVITLVVASQSLVVAAEPAPVVAKADDSQQRVPVDLRVELSSMPKKVKSETEGTVFGGGLIIPYSGTVEGKWDDAGRVNLMGLANLDKSDETFTLMVGGAITLTRFTENDGMGYKNELSAFGFDGLVGGAINLGNIARIELMPFAGFGLATTEDSSIDVGQTGSGDGSGVFIDYGIRGSLVFCTGRRQGPTLSLTGGWIGMNADVDYEGTGTIGRTRIIIESEDEHRMRGGFGAMALGWRF
jgi:hypothetical protein